MHFHERHSLAVPPHGTLETSVSTDPFPKRRPKATGIRGRGRFRGIEIPDTTDARICGAHPVCPGQSTRSRPLKALSTLPTVHRSLLPLRNLTKREERERVLLERSSMVDLYRNSAVAAKLFDMSRSRVWRN